VTGRWPVPRILVLAASCLSIASPPASAQTSDTTTVPSTKSQSPFQLKVSSNLVVVRAVVRDAEGNPVEGLRKEDFQILDRGKEQAISHFEVETTPPQPMASTPAHAPGQAAVPAATTAPGRFLVFYFDDLNTPDADMIYVRDDADHYLAANLQPQDRVAIFTSTKMLSDFTADPQQIHSALDKLKTSGRSMMRIHDCPDLSDYQALQITEQENPEYSDAWETALDEAANRCHMMMSSPGDQASTADVPKGGNPSSSLGDSALANTIRSMARNIVFQTELQARSNLLQLERVVDYIGQMPGQRTVIFVSPGFLSESEQFSLDRVIDHALRAQVVISALDPRGLALLTGELDASRQWIPGHPGTAERLASQRELVAASVLSELAQGTGGELFHNNNDLKAGFGALAGSPVYYVLAFAPSDLKPDGRFHPLKVKLVEKQKNVSVQARRGYFAPRNKAEAEAEARQQAAFDTEAQAQEQIREAMFSKADSQQLPVGLGGKLSEGPSGTRELSIFSHLDAKPLHFQKEGEHNLNTVTFVVAVFDQKDDLISGQRKRVGLNLRDAQLQELFKDGVNVSLNFQLKPGIYRIREVVTDSQEHHLTARSTTIQVP
jgi:VWFA-related protein